MSGLKVLSVSSAGIRLKVYRTICARNVGGGLMEKQMREVVFETDRLELCVPCIEDVDALVGYWSNPETMKYLGMNGDVWTREQVVERVERGARYCKERGMTFWTVIEKATGAVIGQGGLVPIAFNGDEVELGYRFGKAHWGKGYATELAKAAAMYGFGELDLDRLVAVCYAENAGSQKVLVRTGFAEQGMTDLYYDTRLMLFRLEKSSASEQGG